MGKIFDNIQLTKPGVQDASGNTTYYNSPGAQAMAYAKQEAQAVQPSDSVIPGGIPYVNDDGSPSDTAAPRPFFLPPAQHDPKLVQPSYQEASTQPNGMPAANTPALTKAGKLVQVLSLVAKGGMAGHAANEEATIQSGGRRSGGAGIGFMAGLEEPEREVMNQQQVQHGNLENQLVQANVKALPWMRAAQVAAAQARVNRDNATAAWRQWQINNGGKATPEEQIAAKLRIAENADFDPEETKQFVYGIKPTKDPSQPHDQLSVFMQEHPGSTIEDFWKAQQKNHPGAYDNEFRHFMADNPDATVEDFWAARNSTPRPATRGQEAAATTRKNNALRKVESDFRVGTIDVNELNARKQDIQNAYEEEVATRTGNTPEHYDYSTQQTASGQQPAASPAASAPPQKSPAPQPKAAGKQGLQVNQNVMVGGKPAVIVGFNKTTGKPIIRYTQQ